MKKTILNVLCISAAAWFMTSCGSKGPVKGADLKAQDAVTYLAGDEKKCWKLDSGHDYYEYLEFHKDKNEVAYQNGTILSYQVNGGTLTIKDFQDFVYSIVEVSDEKLVMCMSGHDTLVYLQSEKSPETGKNLSENIDARWLKGKHGTVWKFDGSDKVYSYMNDGNIIDSRTLQKLDSWKIDRNILQFGPNNLTILRLGSVFFDYDVYGITVKLNYLCEANKDGSPVRSI